MDVKRKFYTDHFCNKPGKAALQMVVFRISISVFRELAKAAG